MATANVNGVRLFYELRGGKVPLVLVHGSWDSHYDWDPVVPLVVDSFRVLTYDRRGHSNSARLPGQGCVREDVADLAALFESLGLAPAWVAGNSFGASIVLRLAGSGPISFEASWLTSHRSSRCSPKTPSLRRCSIRSDGGLGL